MAFFTDTQTQTAGFTAKLAHMFETLSDTMKRRKIARTTYAELAGLSDRELNDLGISRGDIRRLAREAAQGAL